MQVSPSAASPLLVADAVLDTAVAVSGRQRHAAATSLQSALPPGHLLLTSRSWREGQGEWRKKEGGGATAIKNMPIRHSGN
jgi:hypothetical protein